MKAINSSAPPKLTRTYCNVPTEKSIGKFKKSTLRKIQEFLYKRELAFLLLLENLKTGNSITI